MHPSGLAPEICASQRSLTDQSTPIGGLPGHKGTNIILRRDSESDHSFPLNEQYLCGAAPLMQMAGKMILQDSPLEATIIALEPAMGVKIWGSYSQGQCKGVCNLGLG